jgi:hypothetical protein
MGAAVAMPLHQPVSPKDLCQLMRGLTLALASAFLLWGCGVFGPRLVNHAFSFEVSDGVEVLDYRYGNSRQPGARATEEEKRTGRGFPGGGVVHGDILLGDEVYARWRLKATGEIIEDSVDLRKRLPRDMTDHHIQFAINDRQLYVFLMKWEAPLPGELEQRHQSLPYPNFKFARPWRQIYPADPSEYRKMAAKWMPNATSGRPSRQPDSP